MQYKPRYFKPIENLKRNYPCTVTGTKDYLERDKHYAYLKHKAQAKYRGEAYELTREDWMTLWDSDEAFLNRGRHCSSLCLVRCDLESAWHIDNVRIVERGEILRSDAIKRWHEE